MPQDALVDAFWVNGVNSLPHPSQIGEGEYQWATNVDNSGGLLHTRPGFRIKGPSPYVGTATWNGLKPRGMGFFKTSIKTQLLIAVGDKILISEYPFRSYSQLTGAGSAGDGFQDSAGAVTFTNVIRTVSTNSDGSRTVLADPVRYLVLSDGYENPLLWNGTTLVTSFLAGGATFSIPTGRWMQFIGGRLWVADTFKVHASDLGDPLSFWEENNVSNGGAFYFPDNVTGLFSTPDLRNLLVATSDTVSSLQAGVLDRAQWFSTKDFQRVLLPGVGCVAGKSFCNQFGLTFWYSQGGLVSFDQAKNTYLTSKISYRDQEMDRSKGNLDDDISSIVCQAHGNYLLVAVPIGGRNSEIWVLNQDSIGASGDGASWMGKWTGISPVDMQSITVSGQELFLALSDDESLINSVSSSSPNVWELFRGEREDSYDDRPVRIECSWESKLIGMSKDLKKFEWAEIDISEIRGVVNLEVWVASRRGGYHKILDKRMVSSEGNVNTQGLITTLTEATNSPASTGETTYRSLLVDSIAGFKASGIVNIGGKRIYYFSKTISQFNYNLAASQNAWKSTVTFPAGTQVTQPLFTYPNNATILESYVPQTRTVRTNGWDETTSGPVESTTGDNVDRAFSILVKWTGKMAIVAVGVVMTPIDDYVQGKCEEDELYMRTLDADGNGEVSETAIQEITSTLSRSKHKRMRTNTPRYYDANYESYRGETVV